MLSRSALRGYILEELLAKLLKSSGYSLLVRADQDPVALVPAANGLRVRGRGADHQVDVLGELDRRILFSLPVRLFVEAKYRSSPVGLAEVRNALGVINDVNEHYSAAAASRMRPEPFHRYHYRYTLFSASGFTADAQQFAYTQQISLVGLDGPAFQWLLRAVDRAADQLLELAATAVLISFPVNQMRTAFRRALGTWTVEEGIDADDGVDDVEDYAAARRRADRVDGGQQGPRLPAAELAEIAAGLVELDGTLYFGFTTTPFLMVLQPDDPASFDEPTRVDGAVEDVRLAFAPAEGGGGDWVLAAADGTKLRFGLPPLYEHVLLADDPSGRRRRGRRVDSSGTVQIVSGARAVTLRFDPVEDTVSVGLGPIDERTSRLREVRSDPSLSYREERDGRPHATDKWTSAAAIQLVARLRKEKTWRQAEVILAAARNGGFVNRADVYRIAGYPEQRTLRGFTRPVRRITETLRAAGVLAEDAGPALSAVYDQSVLATRFQVPAEFVDIVPSEFE